MRITKSVVFGLVSLVCTVNATQVTGKPILAKRLSVVTITNNGCTAVCNNLPSLDLGQGVECDVFCDGGFSTSLPATPTSTESSTVIVTVTTTTEGGLVQRTPVTSTGATDGACHEICIIDEDEGDFDCTLECDVGFSSLMPATPTSQVALSTSTSEVAFNKRSIFTTVDGDCTAVCWDLMPGTECDMRCLEDFKTEMPVPSKAARVANLEARENVQAHHVHEARLARKFGGLVARDDAVTVTVTSIPDYCTAGPESSISTVAGNPPFLPMQAPQAAGTSAESAFLSQASAAISAARQALPSAASSALSEASAFLSSIAATAPNSANATAATPAPTGSAPTISATTTATSESTASTTTTGSPIVSEAGTTTSTSSPATGAASDYTVSAGLVLSLLVGLAVNVAFLV